MKNNYLGIGCFRSELRSLCLLPFKAIVGTAAPQWTVRWKHFICKRHCLGWLDVIRRGESQGYHVQVSQGRVPWCQWVVALPFPSSWHGSLRTSIWLYCLRGLLYLAQHSPQPGDIIMMVILSLSSRTLPVYEMKTPGRNMWQRGHVLFLLCSLMDEQLGVNEVLIVSVGG